MLDANLQAPLLTQRRVRTPPEWLLMLKAEYEPADMTSVLHPLPAKAALRVDGVTLFIVPQELIAGAALAGALWSIRPAAVNEAAVNKMRAMTR